MTGRDLLRRLLDVPAHDLDTAEVRVVFHGRTEPSFNRPLSSTSGDSVGLNLIVEEDEATTPNEERPVIPINDKAGDTMFPYDPEDPSDAYSRFSIYQDVAEVFCPGDYDHGNYDAEERIQERMREKGCHPRKDVAPFNERLTITFWATPVGDVIFDTESGGFCIYADELAPAEYVRDVILEIKAELDAHREALR